MNLSFEINHTIMMEFDQGLKDTLCHFRQGSARSVDKLRAELDELKSTGQIDCNKFQETKDFIKNYTSQINTIDFLINLLDGQPKVCNIELHKSVVGVLSSEQIRCERAVAMIQNELMMLSPTNKRYQDLWNILNSNHSRAESIATLLKIAQMSP